MHHYDVLASQISYTQIKIKKTKIWGTINQIRITKDKYMKQKLR